MNTPSILQPRRQFLRSFSLGMALVTVPGAFAEELIRTPRQTEDPSSWVSLRKCEENRFQTDCKGRPPPLRRAGQGGRALLLTFDAPPSDPRQTVNLESAASMKRDDIRKPREPQEKP